MKRITGIMMLGLLAVSTMVSAETIVSTHAVYGEFVERIGGDAVKVVTIIPSGFCPSHYDLAPSDLAAVLDASVILYSGFESWIETLADATAGRAQLVQLGGSWSTPDAAVAKVEAILDLLVERMPAEADRFRANAATYLDEIGTLADELTARAASVDTEETSVVCMAWQVDFVSWLGFDIAVTYGIPEGLSLRDLVELAEAGRDAGAELVIDNLQSGIDFGAKLAREIGAIHVVLSNFPGAMPGSATVVDLFRRNADALFSAIEPIE